MDEAIFRAVPAVDIAPRAKQSGYPEPFRSRVQGRSKRQLGNAFGLQNFGVNLTELMPQSESALLHRHTTQDEFIFILEGNPTLRTEDGEQVLAPGMVAGFPANGIAHQLVNRTNTTVRYLEIGDRSPNDRGEYPEDDLVAELESGSWVFKHKDGTPYSRG